MQTRNVRAPDIAPSQLAWSTLTRKSWRSLVDDLVEAPVGYDPQATLLLSVASAWAYSDLDTFSAVMARHGLANNRVHCVCVSNHALLVDLNAYFVQSPCGRLAILCFRGTEPTNIIDWLSGSSVRKVEYPGGGHVHEGFYRNVQVLAPDLFEHTLPRALAGEPIFRTDAVRSLEPVETGPLEALYVTGHSLGGALALMTAAMLVDGLMSSHSPHADVLRGVYTFGQPMVGDPDFAAACDAKLKRRFFRHVYDRDVVPRLPPRGTGRFAHAGQRYVSARGGWSLSSERTRQVLSALVAFPVGAAAWVLQQLPILHQLPLPYSIYDHSPLHYMQQSQEALGIETEFA